MSIVKIVFRVFILSILFLLICYIFAHIYKIYQGSDPIIHYDSYFRIFLYVFFPFLLSSIMYFYSKNVLLGKVFYWLIALIPVVFFILSAAMVTSEFRDIKEYPYLLVPLFLILAFYYNYRMINKELDKKKI